MTPLLDSADLTSPRAEADPKPLALVVLLENVGHILGLNLPDWAKNIIDFVTEEYAKILLRIYGAHRRYDQVIILEDALATGPTLAHTLVEQSQTHRIDLLLLVHGKEGALVGYKGEKLIGPETFVPLVRAYRNEPTLIDLRVVYGLNCHGASLAHTWLALGADAVNGSVGVNWFPEPSLSIFLRKWLGGADYSIAVCASNHASDRVWRRILPANADQPTHPWISSSRQTVFGQRDRRIDSV